jgi:leucyl/phenylalanyl-tRNA---protein transferase
MTLSFTPRGILLAYCNGIFPMADEDGQIGWYRPDPRAILPLEEFYVSRSLAKTIRQARFEVRVNTDFEGVMRGCADREEGSWISERFVRTYGELHRMGFAHSVEAWREGRLVGGTYGLAIGGAFMAESMFHYETDASKIALGALVSRLKEREFRLLDVQFVTPHLAGFRAMEITAEEYEARLLDALPLERSFA